MVAGHTTPSALMMSIQELKERIGQHRRAYYAVIKNRMNCDIFFLFFCDKFDATYSMGLHLKDVHNFKNRSNFNDSFRSVILVGVGYMSQNFTFFLSEFF